MSGDDIQAWTQAVHHGDALDLLDELPAESVHAVVTDPPYGLAFMGRDWDDFEPKEYQEWCEEWAAKAKHALKPGGHLLAFSGNRTHHRLFTGVEDAGFEVRDTITWHYGNGFPKNTDLFLKPATEFVVFSRRPFDGSAADCYEKHGTAYINIDGCRIDTREETQDRGAKTKVNTYNDIDVNQQEGAYPESLGRYPANVVFGERAATELDEKSPSRTETDREISGGGSRHMDFDGMGDTPTKAYSGSGGPSRYFYTSKATRAERTLDGRLENDHPTVKPQDLMEWLVKLVTRREQIVLDPFAGSGTTLAASKDLDRRFIGFEKQARYVSIAQARVGLDVDDPSVFDQPEDQSTVTDFGGGPNL